ncbi:hypothetical protein M422DRAFT_247274 [Sphaerobolus stellatus SS14]|nr:hypothetical protein M422DRAFT_247274 [Sphaerobolus stellatus SS14]
MAIRNDVAGAQSQGGTLNIAFPWSTLRELEIDAEFDSQDIYYIAAQYMGLAGGLDSKPLKELSLKVVTFQREHMDVFVDAFAGTALSLFHLGQCEAIDAIILTRIIHTFPQLTELGLLQLTIEDDMRPSDWSVPLGDFTAQLLNLRLLRALRTNYLAPNSLPQTPDGPDRSDQGYLRAVFLTAQIILANGPRTIEEQVYLFAEHRSFAFLKRDDIVEVIKARSGAYSTISLRTTAWYVENCIFVEADFNRLNAQRYIYQVNDANETGSSP